MLDKIIPLTLVSLATLGALSYYTTFSNNFSFSGENLADDELFTSYLEIHGKTYSTIDEYKFRRGLFMEKHQMIIDFNKKITFEVGHNEFSDWTKDELKSLSGFIPDEDESSISEEIDFKEETAVMDAFGSFNWTIQGGVTEVYH